MLPALQDIIAGSPTGDLTFLVTEHGQPFTANGFGNKIRQWCDEAGLPHCTAHGLRKAGAVIAAENGATAHQLMSVFGWLTLKEAERYRKDGARKSYGVGTTDFGGGVACAARGCAVICGLVQAQELIVESGVLRRFAVQTSPCVLARYARLVRGSWSVL